MKEFWYKNAIVYAIDVDTFQDANGDGIGDFDGLLDRLDHLVDLGITVIWLLPCQPTPNRDNGYDVQNYYDVDSRYGSLDSFLAFVRAAGERGIRVIMDLVVNHTSNEHPWFRAARLDPGSAYRDYYVWSDIPPPVAPGKGTIFPGQEDTVWTYDEVAGAYYYHRFYAFEPGLNYANPAVRAEVRCIMDFWISFGIAGFRVDAASHMIEEKSVESDGPDDPHSVLRELREFVEKRRPGTVLLGEADVQPEHLADFFGEGDELNLLLNFLLNNYLFLALAREEASPIERVLHLTPAIPHHGHWANFLRNLDEVDLERLTEEERAEVFEKFAPDPEMRIYGRGIRRRLAPMLGGDPDRLRLAFSLLFSMPGSPLLVYGDEIGMGDDLSLEGRNAVRTPMQWSGERNAGFSTAEAARLSRPVIREGDFSYRRVNVEAQKGDPSSILNWMKELVRVRRECPEIGWGAVHMIDSADPAVFAHRCTWKGSSTIFVHNFSSAEKKVSLDLLGHGAEEPSPLIGNAELTNGDGRRYECRLPRYGHLWLRAGGQVETIDLHMHR